MDTTELSRERAQMIEAWARITVNRLAKQLIKKKVGHSNSLYYSLVHRIAAGAGGDIEKVQHLFNYYGKFVDMGVGRGQKIGGVKDREGKGFRPKRWFTKPYYAEVATLGELLMHKYAEDTTRIIKEGIELNFKK